MHSATVSPRKVRINQQLSRAAIAVSVAAAGVAVLLAWAVEGLLVEIVFPVLFAFATNAVALVARLLLVGFVSDKAWQRVPKLLRRLNQWWVLAKIGLLGSLLYLLVALGVAFVAGWNVTLFARALVFILLVSVLGTMIVLTALNIGMISQRKAMRSHI